MRKVLGVSVLMIGLLGLMATPALALTEHCPDHDGHPGKIESGAAGNDVVLPAGTEFCVKAGPFATGVLIADGTTTLLQYVEQAGITVGEGDENVPDVSYYVVYEYAPRTDVAALAGGQVPVEFAGGSMSPLLIVALITLVVGFIGARVGFGRITRRS